MTVSMAAFQLLQMAPSPILPFGVGPIPLLHNHFHHPSFLSDNLDAQMLPWQQSNQLQLPWQQNYHEDSLHHLLQQNEILLDTPFSQQYTQNNDNLRKNQLFSWQQNQVNVFRQDNFDNNNYNQGQSQEQDWSQLQLKAANYNVFKDGKENKEGNDEKTEELHEQFEEWLEKTDEQKKQTFEDLQFFIILLFPFLIFDKPVAYYFASTKLLSFLLSKYGISTEDDVMFMQFIQCVDVLALMRGQLKFVDDYKSAWYQELYDYVLTKLGFNATFRYGTQMAMPQAGAPSYTTE